jgi:hypothetical protein
LNATVQKEKFQLLFETPSLFSKVDVGVKAGVELDDGTKEEVLLFGASLFSEESSTLNFLLSRFRVRDFGVALPPPPPPFFSLVKGEGSTAILHTVEEKRILEFNSLHMYFS